jgi:hypothetical protein
MFNEMTITESIVSKLRTFFGQPDATEAELEQHLEDRLTETATEEDIPDDPEDTTTETAETVEQSPLESATETEPAPQATQVILTALTTLQESVSTLQAEVAALKKTAVSAPTDYEVKTSETDGRDKYLCSTTKRAMGLK